MAAKTLPPPTPTNPLFVVDSWVCEAGGFIRGKALDTDPLSPADGMFVLQTENLGKQQSWSGQQTDTLMTAQSCGAPALIESAACRTPVSINQIIEHPLIRAHTTGSSSRRQNTRLSLLNWPSWCTLPCILSQDMPYLFIIMNPRKL